MESQGSRTRVLDVVGYTLGLPSHEPEAHASDLGGSNVTFSSSKTGLITPASLSLVLAHSFLLVLKLRKVY